MSRSISQDFRDNIYSPEMLSVPLITFRLSHPDLLEDILVVNNNENIVWNGDTFLATSFKFTPPSMEESKEAGATVSICNVDRRLISLIRSIQGGLTAEANLIVVGDTIEREAGPWFFYMNQITYNKDSVTGSLTSNYRSRQVLSTIKINVNNFPGIVEA